MPSAWSLTRWTGPTRSAYGNACTRHHSGDILACGRPWSSASLARRPGWDEQDPSPVHQRLLGQPVQGDPLPGGHARHQPPDLRVGPCCRQTYHGDLLWPRTPESHVWNILMWKPSCTPAGAGTPCSTWLSDQASLMVSNPGKVTWSISTSIPSWPGNHAIVSGCLVFKAPREGNCSQRSSQRSMVFTLPSNAS